VASNATVSITATGKGKYRGLNQSIRTEHQAVAQTKNQKKYT
jgi:hypothetical protein